MKYYKANRRWQLSIEEVEVQRETSSSVWLEGKSGSERKLTKYSFYTSSREESKNLLIRDCKFDLERKQIALDQAKKYLLKAESL